MVCTAREILAVVNPTQVLIIRNGLVPLHVHLLWCVTHDANGSQNVEG